MPATRWTVRRGASVEDVADGEVLGVCVMPSDWQPVPPFVVQLDDDERRVRVSDWMIVGSAEGVSATMVGEITTELPSI